MRVICIDDSKGKIYGNTPTFKSGDELDVLQSYKYDDCYAVIGHEITKEGKYAHWIKNRFIPLSSIDEIEFERNYKKETV